MVSHLNSLACTMEDVKTTRAFPSGELVAPAISADMRRCVKYQGPVNKEHIRQNAIVKHDIEMSV